MVAVVDRAVTDHASAGPSDLIPPLFVPGGVGLMRVAYINLLPMHATAGDCMRGAVQRSETSMLYTHARYGGYEIRTGTGYSTRLRTPTKNPKRNGISCFLPLQPSAEPVQPTRALDQFAPYPRLHRCRTDYSTFGLFSYPFFFGSFSLSPSPGPFLSATPAARDPPPHLTSLTSPPEPPSASPPAHAHHPAYPPP